MRLIAELTMPRVASWNGKWSGEGEKYTKAIHVNKKYVDKLTGEYHYRWDDGWCACVTIRKPIPRERVTNRFCGYEWMIESIREYGEIRI